MWCNCQSDERLGGNSREQKSSINNFVRPAHQAAKANLTTSGAIAFATAEKIEGVSVEKHYCNKFRGRFNPLYDDDC